MKYEIYLLYSDPVEGMRTGHAALALVYNEKIIRYFSMYHTEQPDVVRHLSIWHRFTSSIPAYFVTSYENDVVMRGQSIKRFDDQEKENISVPDILDALNRLDPETKRQYFNRGQFHHALKLEVNVFQWSAVFAILKNLMDSRSSTAWTLCAPFTTIFFDSTAHNCCSVITKALHYTSEEREPDSPSILMKVFYIAYFIMLYTAYFSMQDSVFFPIICLPALYPILLLLRSINNARLYVNDLAKMAKQGGPDIFTLTMVSLFCVTVNLLGSPFSDNACFALLSFPGALARSLKAMPDVKEIKPLPTFFTTFSADRQPLFNNAANFLNTEKSVKKPAYTNNKNQHKPVRA